jgi:hypothetical protein
MNQLIDVTITQAFAHSLRAEVPVTQGVDATSLNA